MRVRYRLQAMDFTGTEEACKASALEENVESAQKDLTMVGRIRSFVSSAWE